MKNENILNDYICTTPFTYLEIHKNDVYSCCPSWLPNKLTSTGDIKNAWKSDELKKIQESIIDGSYKYCSKIECPYLSSLISTGKKSNCFTLKKNFNIKKYKDSPTNINFAFDRSCNLSCPSCRNFGIMADGTEIEFIDNTINSIIDTYGKNLTFIYLSGTADPFASKSFRKFLLKFDKNKLPNVKTIHLHTNGILLNKEMWNSLSHIHDLIQEIEISIDAANEKTYQLIRRGGDWQTLINNLNFISTLKIKDKKVSFVVQDTNYMEMSEFYYLMSNIFNNKIDIFFNKITNWGTYSESEFKIKQIWNETHPEFKMFLNELNRVKFNYNVIHNMNDIVDKYLPKKINSLI